jgi:hypothetical protein
MQFDPTGIVGATIDWPGAELPTEPSRRPIDSAGTTTVDMEGLFKPQWKKWCEATCESKQTVANLYCQAFGLGNSESFSCPCTKGNYEVFKATGVTNVRATWECERDMFPDEGEIEPAPGL